MYLSPREQWPRHDRPLARAALEEARSAGWWFKPSEGGHGHSFGRLRCGPPSEIDRDSAHWTFVFSTSGAEDGSATAGAIRDVLRKCDHHQDENPEPVTPEGAANRASGALAEAERLIEAGGELFEKHKALREADLALDEALQLEDDTAKSEAVEVASDHEDRAQVHDVRALAAAAQAGASDPWPPANGARELANIAAERLSNADKLIAAAKGSDDENRLAAESNRVALRLRSLSTRLDADR